MEDKTANNKINVGTLNKFNESKTKRQLNAAPNRSKKYIFPTEILGFVKRPLTIIPEKKNGITILKDTMLKWKIRVIVSCAIFILPSINKQTRIEIPK